MLKINIDNIGDLAVVECEGRIVQSEAAFKLREAVTDVYFRGEAQQLCARVLLAHHNLTAQVKPNQMKDCLAKINADRM
jgi:hypothetical protein